MKRARKRHVQQDLVFHRRGGKRRGAGRKPIGPRRRVPHRRREAFSAHQPLHVTMRILDEVGRLRIRKVLRAIAQAMAVVAGRTDFRMVHCSIQDNHLHAMCEANSREALSSGIAAFKTSAGRRINRHLDRGGTVFADRYHVEIVRTPTQARAALCYVMNNWRKHGADRGSQAWVDPFSTGMHFRGWRETPQIAIPPDAELLPYTPPKTWLLREGWKKCRPISLFERPGSHR
jgi:putative transposase